MNRLTFLLIVATISIIGCSNQKVSFTKAISNDFPPLENHFSNYWSAMYCGMPQFADSFAVDDEKQIFACGLYEIQEGSLGSAEEKFTELANSKNDTIKNNSIFILSSIYFYQSRWQEHLRISKGEKESEDEAEKRIVTASFRRAPVEVISFDSEVDTLPIVVRNKSIFIPVSINGKSYEFLFDTGAGLSVLSESVAQDCNVSYIKTNESGVIASTGKSLGSKTATIDKLQIGNMNLLNHPTIAVSDDDMKFTYFFITFHSFDGIIGWNAIKHMDVEIDLEKEIMILRKPRKRDIADRNFFWLNDPIIKAKSKDGIDLFFFFDAGAGESHFYDVFLEKTQPVGLEEDSETYYGLGGKVTKDVKVIPKTTISIAGYDLNITNLNSSEPIGSYFFALDGVLGLNVCHGGKFRIDAQNGVFEMEKYKSQ